MSSFDFDLPAEASAKLLSLANEVAKLKTPEPIIFGFGFHDICNFRDSDLVAKIPQDLKGKTKCIYVFHLLDGATKDFVAAAFPKEKDARDGRAFARFLGGKGTCLYVGSCFKTSTLSRLKQHFGLSKSVGTYAMPLKHWTHDIPGGVEVSVFSYGMDVSHEALQAVEDCLHSRLEPILGKKGGS
jgi:hypothetical protein